MVHTRFAPECEIKNRRVSPGRQDHPWQVDRQHESDSRYWTEQSPSPANEESSLDEKKYRCGGHRDEHRQQSLEQQTRPQGYPESIGPSFLFIDDGSKETIQRNGDRQGEQYVRDHESREQRIIPHWFPSLSLNRILPEARRPKLP